MNEIPLAEMLKKAVPVKIEVEIDLTGKNVGLAIVDPVRGFCEPGAGKLAPIEADWRIDMAIDVIDAFARYILSKGGKVFLERDVHSANTIEEPYPEHCVSGSGEELLVKKLEWLLNHPGVTSAMKHCINALIGSMRFGGGSGVIEFIINNQLQILVLSGFCTDICVMEYALTLMSIKNLRQIQFLEKIIVIPNACATYNLPLDVAVKEYGKPEAAHPAEIFHHMGLALMQKSGIILANNIIM